MQYNVENHQNEMQSEFTATGYKMVMGDNVLEVIGEQDSGEIYFNEDFYGEYHVDDDDMMHVMDQNENEVAVFDRSDESEWETWAISVFNNSL